MEKKKLKVKGRPIITLLGQVTFTTPLPFPRREIRLNQPIAKGPYLFLRCDWSIPTHDYSSKRKSFCRPGHGFYLKNVACGALCRGPGSSIDLSRSSLSGNAIGFSFIHLKGTEQDFLREIGQSATLYVGNLSFYTTEEQIYTFFSKSGPVKRIIMGLDKFTKTPCGFCFVE